ncbi:MAG: PolC-type DNA polymerase III, partial [Clostridiales bacterium]|nr:PolC-type DNA polymerase III [Candidatus Blautia equi]
MVKDFFEVFPNLKVNTELQEFLNISQVSKVSCNPARDKVWVYLRSNVWIHKKHILALEEQIAKQCFPGLNVTVKIIERFYLSRQYNPENFLSAYRSSMELELRNFNMLEYNLFKRSEIVFPDTNTMEITMPDSVISRDKGTILVEYLQKVFCERCGMDLKIEVIYVETEESRYRKNAEIQIRQEVENVLKNAGMGGKSEEQSAAEAPIEEKTEQTEKREKTEKTEEAAPKKAAEKTDKKPAEPKEQKTFDKKGGRGEYLGSYRKDSNPDVIYGKDFEGDPITLESITGEMGEVIVSGQVMEIEFREIRNEKTIAIFPITDFTDSITVKMFLRNEMVEDIKGAVKKGAFIKLRGVTTIDRFDSELTIGSITGMKKSADTRKPRTDTAPQKRVELHCHTKMSDMDGVTDAKALVKRA